MHTLFGSGIGRKPRPSSVWWESSQELIDRVRQIEHAEPERHRDQESIDPARNAVDSPQEKARVEIGPKNQPPHRDHPV